MAASAEPHPVGKMFKAYDVRATVPDPMNVGSAYKVGRAAGQFFKKSNNGESATILVSRDMRPHSPELAGALIEGIRAEGMDVVDLGMCDTSFKYFAIPHMEKQGKTVVGGIQTTASHNPINYNGFKMSGKQARPIGADTGLKEIQALAEAVGDDKPELTGSLETLDLWEEYKAFVRSFFTPPKRPLKLYIDASNGMAGSLVPKVFEGLENVEIISINTTMGEGFVHEPNPLVAENMIPTQEGVRNESADLGACFDGDADRCMITDENGETIGCDHLTALLAGHFKSLAEADPDQTKPVPMVYDLRSSKVVVETIEAMGAVPVRSRVGHVFIKAALRESDGIFGGELSGHFYFKQNSFADSGAITLMTVLTLLGQSDQPLSELLKPFRKYPQSGEMNFEVEDKAAVLAQMEETYGPSGKGGSVDKLDGVSIDLWDSKGYWFNVRASNTEPLLRLNAEGKDDAKLQEILGELKPILGEPVVGH